MTSEDGTIPIMALNQQQQEQLTQALVQRGGLNELDARNQALNRGGRAEELAREFGVTTPVSTGGGAPSTDFRSLAREQLRLRQEANRPAIESLQASIPETQAAFAQKRTSLEQERQPLTERYNQILDQISKKEQREIGREERTVSREFGRRGIPLSSGVFDVELGERIRPISERFAETTSDVGFQRESALRNISSQIAGIPGEQAEAIRGVRNAIAQLQAGGASEAITNALTQQQLGISQKQFEAQEARLQQAEDFAEQIFEQTTLPESQAAIKNLESQISKRTNETGSGQSLADFLLGQGAIGQSTPQGDKLTLNGQSFTILP